MAHSPVLYVDQYRLVDSVIAGPCVADKFGYSVTYNLCGAGLIIRYWFTSPVVEW